MNTDVQEAPDLVVWDGTPSIAADGPLLVVTIPPRRGGADLQNVAPRFVDEGGDVLWGVEGATVDPRLLEDRTVRLVSSGYADVTVRHHDGRTIYHQLVATATVPHVGTLVPASRAASCTLPDGGTVGCPLTDGDLVTTTPVDSTGAAVVDLGTPQEVGVVVVRGTGSNLGDPVTVEASEDGTAWVALPERRLTGANGWLAGPRPGTGLPMARYVRVAGADGLAEVSVWAPTEADRLAARPPSASGDGSGAGGDDVPWPLAVLAGALVLAVGAAGLRVRRR